MLLVIPKGATQHWFPLIKDLIVEDQSNTLVLQKSQDLTRLPHEPEAVHPAWQRLNLTCYRLNGKNFRKCELSKKAKAICLAGVSSFLIWD